MPYYQKQSMNLIREAFDRLWNAQYQKIADLAIEAYITKEPLPYSQRLEGERHLFQPGDVWGELWDCGWFHFTGRVPDTACGANVAVMLDLSGEGLVVDQDGNPLLGITTRATSDFDVAKDSKRLVPVADCAQGGEVVDLWVDGGCNDLFGNYRGRGRILQAEIVICHPEFTKLYYDMEVLLNLAEHLPEDSARRAEILYGLNEAAGLLIRTDPDTLRKAGEIFDALLAKRGGDPSLKIIATGHSHIDLAWLWPIRETKRKGARTFSTVLANFEKYPDYYFGASQMQLYQWMKEGYPALYQRVKDKIAEGRWEVQGNMWVENDTNLTGGEAFVRQFLYGRRFAEKEFGKISRMCWLPDTFGYTGSLPQIMKKAGLEYFMTQKLSWDYHNDFPHHTFRWAGIDGTEVLAHMPPENTYNSAILPESVLFTEHNDKDKGVCPEAIMLFGIGDGGGGPGTEHLERISRMQNLSGLPPVEQGSIEAFFERIDQYRDRYKQWKGELYLSRHQGTYTTQARNKWYNRKMESALREAEYACSLAMQKGFPYPQEELEQIWKEVLLYQFHDIIPGSSIKRVYDESLARYELLLKHTRAIMQEAYAALSVSVGEDTPALVYNSLAFDRQAYIQLDGQEYKVKVPAFGYTAVSAENLQKDFHVRAEKNRISNGKLTLTFAEDGAVSSLYDEENRRECLRAPSNRFPVYYDNGNAWDIDIYYSEKAPEYMKLVSSRAYVEGSCAVMEQEYRHGASVLRQKIRLQEDSRKAVFETEADWNEYARMLRAEFNFDLLCNEVTCGIQFGHLKRPTHQNTTWDMAKYEICAQKWADLSQPDYGVTLMTDSKYGHNAVGSMLGLNLLRSTGWPGAYADQAHHRFTYAIYPHTGDQVDAQVWEAAEDMAHPLTVSGTRVTKEALSGQFMCLHCPHIMVEALKKQEDGNGLILRLYEAAGGSSQGSLSFNLPVRSVKQVNLLERLDGADCETGELALEENSVALSFKPFEIKTLLIEW